MDKYRPKFYFSVIIMGWAYLTLQRSWPSPDALLFVLKPWLKLEPKQSLNAPTTITLDTLLALLFSFPRRHRHYLAFASAIDFVALFPLRFDWTDDIKMISKPKEKSEHSTLSNREWCDRRTEAHSHETVRYSGRIWKGKNITFVRDIAMLLAYKVNDFVQQKLAV